MISSRNLNFWKLYLRKVNAYDIAWAPAAKISVFSDASDLACGAYVTINGQARIAHREWVGAESAESSTWRELETVRFCLESFAPILKNRLVQWNSDNQAVPFIVLKGSRRQRLQSLAMQLFTLCMRFNISLEPVWVPRGQNELADAISRIEDFDDWSVRPEIFAHFDRLFGPHTCDCFANDLNTCLEKFYSRFYRPGCFGVNAFAHDWSADVNWLVPPPVLVAQTVKHLIRCKARGTLLVPLWPSASYWPLLFPEHGPLSAIKATVRIPKNSQIFRGGTHRKSIFAAEFFQSPVLVLSLDASKL